MPPVPPKPWPLVGPTRALKLNGTSVVPLKKHRPPPALPAPEHVSPTCSTAKMSARALGVTRKKKTQNSTAAATKIPEFVVALLVEIGICTPLYYANTRTIGSSNPGSKTKTFATVQTPDPFGSNC